MSIPGATSVSLTSEAEQNAALRILHPETLRALNDCVVELAMQAKMTKGRKLRLDATCVQTEIHHLTDSRLLVCLEIVVVGIELIELVGREILSYGLLSLQKRQSALPRRVNAPPARSPDARWTHPSLENGAMLWY